MRFGVHASAVLAFCCACGRVKFDTTINAAFSVPTPLSELNSATDDDDVSMTGDMLEIYFNSSRSGSSKLYRATRARVTDAWSPPQPVDELNTADINNPRVSSDGLALLFASGRAPNAGAADIWIATRPDRTSPWSARHLDELATATGDYEPFLARQDALEIFFVHNLVVGGDSFLYVATRPTPADPFANATELVELNGPGYDGGPWVDSTGKRILFHSHRASSEDIYYATRDGIGAAWTAPVLMPDINSAANDDDPWMSPDGRTIVFSSDRAGDFNLYISTR